MNSLTLAVAGGRKTQSVVERCIEAGGEKRILVLTYTLANQRELRARIAPHVRLRSTVQIQGWFSFLMSHWIRPYLPMKFPGRRLRGLNFDGDPGRYTTGESRFLDDEGAAYRLHLAQLAIETNQAAGTAVLERLGRMYDEVLIDEVQDLNGYDLEVLDALMASPIRLSMVGDVRQALLRTNAREPKNAQFKGIKVKEWFDAREASGQLQIEHAATTWRSNQAISEFADSIFDPGWGFSPTVSRNEDTTGHDGLFVVHPDDVYAYLERFDPMCLRHNANSARSLALPFVNFTIAKGQSADRVLIAPTGPIATFLRTGKRLADTPGCSLYVAVTRARFSVAFVSDLGEGLGLTVWSP